jgi:hypothetical protein
MTMPKHLESLAKWATRAEWGDDLDEMLNLHVGQVCESMDMELDDITDLIGVSDAAKVYQCVLEDFYTRSFGADGRNVVDDYLKRRGWKESPSNRRHIEALRTTVMSLYEIEQADPGRPLAMLDLIRGTRIVVAETSASRGLKVGDRIGARIVELLDRNVLAGGWLPFGVEAADGFLEGVRPEMKRARRQIGKLAKQNKIELGAASSSDFSDIVFLAQIAPAFTMLWLSQRVAEELDENIPAILAEAGDDLALCRLYFQLRSGAKTTELRKRLNGYADLRADGVDFWNWIGPKQNSSEPAGGLRGLLQLEDGSSIFGHLELSAKELKLTTMSRSAAEEGKAIVDGLAGDLLEEPETTIETLGGDSDEGGEQAMLDLRLPASARVSRVAAGRRSASPRKR